MKKLFFSSVCILSLGLVACNEESVNENNNANVAEKTAEISELNTDVSLTEAVAVFQSTHPEVQIHSVELSSNWGNLQYEITGLDNSYEYEMLIDASSKEVLKDTFKIEQESEPLLDFTTIIDPVDAIQTAATTPQVSGMTLTSWKLEAEYGSQNYSINYEGNSSEVEVYVNAVTGELIGVELDD